MSLTLARSATLVLQALITGSVQDSLTTGVPNGVVTVRLIDRDTGLDYPLTGRVLPNGTFAFYGPPETAFPLLATQAYHLRVAASAPNYQSAAFNFDLGPAGGQPAPVTVPVADGSVPDIKTALFQGGGLPKIDISLSLNRNAVQLRGRVFVSDNLTAGVSGATVSVPAVAGFTTTADADGHYRFPNPLPVARTVNLVVTAANFETANITYTPDYTQPVNILPISLKHV